MRRAMLLGFMGTVSLGAMTMATAVQAVEAKRETFGSLPDGSKVDAVVLDSGHGVRVRVIAYGASLQEVSAPDRHGKSANILLGYAKFDDYLKKPQYFGATVGRYANRIAKGHFSLDGHSYSVPVNDGPNSLHGGSKGFDKVLWSLGEAKSGADGASVTLTYVSPDGDMGYPGKLTATAIYTLDAHNRLTIEYRATTDKPTIVNLTNHALFNLAGEGSADGAMGNVLTLASDGYTPVDAELIPTGAITPVAGTPFDFRKPHVVAERLRDARDPQIVIGRGYDHNMVLTGKAGGAPRLAARLADPKSGRVLEILSDQPGIQLYTGNFIDGTTVSKSGKIYRQGDGIALEPQHFPDAPNKPAFAPVRLDPGQKYSNVMVFKLTTDKK